MPVILNIQQAVLKTETNDKHIQFVVGQDSPFVPLYKVSDIARRLHDSGNSWDPIREMLCIDLDGGDDVPYRTHEIELSDVLLLTYED